MEKIFDMTVLSDLRLKIQFCWSINEDGPKTYYIFLNLTEKHIGVEDAISIQKERNDEQWFGFLDEDSQHIMQNQSDTLVITMLVARISMRRTLGDSRSSIIVMYSKTSKRMGIQEKKYTALYQEATRLHKRGHWCVLIVEGFTNIQNYFSIHKINFSDEILFKV